MDHAFCRNIGHNEIYNEIVGKYAYKVKHDTSNLQ